MLPASASAPERVPLSDFENLDHLDDEAWVLHMALFGVAPSPAVASRYRAAIKALLGPAAAADLAILRFRERPAGLETIELALRRQDRKNPLTTRAHAMLYVAECRRDHLHHFVVTRPRRVRAALALVFAVLRTTWLLWRGRSAVGTRLGR